MGVDQVKADVVHQGIGQHPFQAVAHLDAHFPVLQEDGDQHAIVAIGLPRPPSLGNADGDVVQRLALKTFEGGDHQLVGAGLVPGGQLGLQIASFVRAEQMGIVVDPGSGLLGKVQPGRQGSHQDSQQQQPSKAAPQCMISPGHSAVS